MLEGATVLRETDHDPSIAAGASALLRESPQGAAPGRNEPSTFHSAARSQIAAWSMRDSIALPTMVRPSRLTLAATTPPVATAPVVGIQ